MSKILYVATSDIHLDVFHKPYLKWLSDQGHQVDVAVENRGARELPGVHTYHYLAFPRDLIKKELLSSFLELRRLLNRENYDLVHCHTPIPSMLTRLASRHLRKKGLKVLYTAHGFHFYKGAPLSRWLIYYPAEWLLSRMTDGIVTINAIDYFYVKEGMKITQAHYINGIGVDSDRFKVFDQNTKKKIKKELGYNDDEFILLYVAEFIPRKNHKFLLQGTAELVDKIPNLKLILAGTGILMEKMKKLAEDLAIKENVDFLGFRDDVHLLSGIADIGVSTSKHEGLGLGLAEMMMCGVPIVATEDRGHKEMVVTGKNGFLFEQGDEESFIKYIMKLYKDEKLRQKISSNAKLSSGKFDIENSLKYMIEVYNEYL